MVVVTMSASDQPSGQGPKPGKGVFHHAVSSYSCTY